MKKLYMDMVSAAVAVGLLLLVQTRFCAAQMASGAFGPPMVGRLVPRVTADSTWRERSGVSGQNGGIRWQEYRLAGMVPLGQVADEYEWGAGYRLGHWDISSAARLPDSGAPLPDRLWDLEAGLFGRRRLERGWILGGAFTVGSAADRPFYSGDEVAVSALATLDVPQSPTWGWIFSVYYASDRGYLNHVPLPGAALRYRPDETLNVIAGVPFANVQWRPVERLRLEAFYLMLNTVRTEIAYSLTEDLEIYAGFAWDHRRFHRHDRADDDDSLYYYEKRLAGGLRCQVTEKVSLDASGGLAFDRFFFEGERYRDRGDDRINLGDSLFAKLALAVAF